MRRELTYPISLLLTIGIATNLFAQLPAGGTSAGIGNPAVAA